MSVRSFRRNRIQAEEEESVFVTMTDMTISFLLIVMILLAFFATLLNTDDTVPRFQYDQILMKYRESQAESVRLERLLEERTVERDDAVLERDRALELNSVYVSQIRDLSEELEERTKERDEAIELINQLISKIQELEKEIERLKAELKIVTDERDRLREELKKMRQINPLEAYLSEAIEQRRRILERLKSQMLIEFPDLEVIVSPEKDALRFQGEGLFRSGWSQLEKRQRGIVQTMGRLLDDILICYTLGPRASRDTACDSGSALIEAVQIEGHTDSDGTDEDNLVLSTARANTTFLVILDQNRDILDHENTRRQPVMSVSGYGEMRPVATNDTPEGKAENRRIDLRILMYAPSTVEEVERIERQVEALRTTGDGA